MSERRRSTLHRVAVTGLAAVLIFWGIFALMSGAEEFGGGLRGLVRNAPNALPWAIALGLLALADRFPMTGGLTFMALAVYTVIAFHGRADPVTFLTISAPVLVFGALLAWSGRRG